MCDSYHTYSYLVQTIELMLYWKLKTHNPTSYLEKSSEIHVYEQCENGSVKTKISFMYLLDYRRNYPTVVF